MDNELGPKLQLKRDREKRLLIFTHGQFQTWVQSVLQNSELAKKLADASDGVQHWSDLDEGDAGVFPNRTLTLMADVVDLVPVASAEDRLIVATYLIGELLENVSLQTKGHGHG